MVRGDCDQIFTLEVSERGGENRGALINIKKTCKYKGHPKALYKRAFVKFSTYHCSERAMGHRGGEVKEGSRRKHWEGEEGKESAAGTHPTGASGPSPRGPPPGSLSRPL